MIRWAYGHWQTHWIFWIRVFGLLFVVKSAGAFKYFSERNGYVRWHYIGPIKFRFGLRD